MNQQKKSLLEQDSTVMARANHVSELLKSIPGANWGREGLAETPLRVAAMYNELFSGYGEDAEQILRDAIFDDVNCKDMVLVKNITFSSMCEHHMMPFFGTVSIAYIPQDGRVVGLSKLARIVDTFGKRLQVQERMGKEIADAIENVMNPKGLAVIIKAEHTCMTARGINKPGSQTVTSCLRGAFFLDGKSREELYNALKL